ncbi:hypothetical protein K431DRAFT_74040 [Polychaeton citri CBS 116435]|uniref:Uncharacterized protein n=1 Tax=Polychaeton citri CBS 116435 TaxID=1314669 RepID=A0A9P4QAF8_9PEZI|nr:hypothetical protein K431DRAFT_74040 [Polychaeton citri CBS 116435]
MASVDLQRCRSHVLSPYEPYQTFSSWPSVEVMIYPWSKERKLQMKTDLSVLLALALPLLWLLLLLLLLLLLWLLSFSSDILCYLGFCLLFFVALCVRFIFFELSLLSSA